MKRLCGILAGAALVTALTAATAFASPHQIEGPPTSTWFTIRACADVPAGEPFSVRLGGFASGTRGLVEAGINSDNSTITVERPLGTVIPASFAWQVPTLQSDSSWVSWRWSDVFVLAAGEQMKVTFVQSIGATVDVYPASSDVDPTSYGYPPYDGTGLVIGPVFNEPFTFARSCTITGT